MLRVLPKHWIRRSPLEDADGKSLAPQRHHQFADLAAAARLDGDIELGRLGNHAAEQPLVLHFDDIAAGLADQAGDPGELARQVADHQPQPHDPVVAHQPAQQHRGQQAGVDVAAAQHQPDPTALEAFAMAQ